MTPAPRFDRRILLVTGAAALLAGGGCTLTDPRILGGDPTPPPEPSPTPTATLAGLDAAIATEAELGQLMGLLAAEGPRLKLGPATSQVAAWARRDHEAHSTALRGRRPMDRPTTEPTPTRGFTPRPAPTPSAALPGGDRTAVLRGVTARLAQAADAYRRQALAASGSPALLWGSLAAYASGLSSVLGSDAPRAEASPTPNRPLDPWSDAEAIQQVVRQLHALVYGYQAAYPAFRRPEDRQVFDLIQRRRDERDRLTAWLRDHLHPVPPAEPAYTLPVRPTDRVRAGELLRTMEAAFQPFAGAWVAAATDEGMRRSALTALEDSTRLALQWGAPLPVWPGWPA